MRPGQANVLSIREADLRHGNAEGVRRLGQGLETAGIIEVQHEIDPNVIRALCAVIARIPDISLHDRRRLSFSEPGALRRGSYALPQRLVVATESNATRLVTFADSWWCGSQPSWNLWPPEDVVPRAAASIREGLEAFGDLALTISAALADYLGDGAKRLCDVIESADSYFGGHQFILQHYPAFSPEALRGHEAETIFVRLGAHRDETTLITLALGTDVGGLQIKPLGSDCESDPWLTVDETGPQSVFVFTGSIATMLTAGRFRPTLHRVIGNRCLMGVPRMNVAYGCTANPLKTWTNAATGETVHFKGRALKPGAWFPLLRTKPDATEDDLANYLEGHRTAYQCLQRATQGVARTTQNASTAEHTHSGNSSDLVGSQPSTLASGALGLDRHRSEPAFVGPVSKT